MAKTFFPELIEHISASPPHPVDTEYRVSVGMEDWEGSFVPVAKVQMVYKGAVAGRKSPSYPIGTRDYDNVNKILGRLVKEASAKYDVTQIKK
jgi:hypothetical protein